MMERTVTPMLIFLMLAGSTYGVAREWIAPRGTAVTRSAAEVVRLPQVEVIGRRSVATPVEVAETGAGTSARAKVQ